MLIINSLRWGVLLFIMPSLGCFMQFSLYCSLFVCVCRVKCIESRGKCGVGVVLVSSLWYRTQSGWEDRATAGAPVDLRATESCVCVWSTALLSPACTDATLFLFQIITADFSLQSCHSRRQARRLFSPLSFFLFFE